MSRVTSFGVIRVIFCRVIFCAGGWPSRRPAPALAEALRIKPSRAAQRSQYKKNKDFTRRAFAMKLPDREIGTDRLRVVDREDALDVRKADQESPP